MQDARRPGFGPVYSPRSRVLLLGSFPSPKSFAYGFYYGHPQNRFWPLLAALAHRPAPGTIDEKKALILGCGLALWDALERCTVTGAADASIRDEVPNDIPALIAKTRITAVFCNGAAACRFYTRHSRPVTGLDAVCLPSTSPANAAFSLERLLAAWQPLGKALFSES